MPPISTSAGKAGVPSRLEAELADPVAQRPVVATVVAGVATVVVIAVILLGPALVTCSSDAAGLGACLQSRLVAVGVLPAPIPPVMPDADVAGGGDVPPATTDEGGAEVASLPPATSGAENATAAGEPEFGLLRAEPDGSMVIAGSGEPGSELELFANGELIGSTVVENTGDWVIVPDRRIAPGGAELTLAVKGEETQAAQSFVVVIDPERQAEPLVVASTPGEASEILQGLERAPDASVAETAPGSEPEREIAAVDPSAVAPDAPAPAELAEDGPVPLAEAEPEPEPAPEAASEPELVSENDDRPLAAERDAAEDPTVRAAPTPAAAASTEPAVSPAEEPDADAASTPQAAPIAPVIVPRAEPEATSEPEQETAVAAVDPEQITPPASADVPAVTMPPTIDAIEIDAGRNFFAGAGPEGQTIRLYVDDEFVADAQVADGRWLVEAGSVLTEPTQRVRADLLAPGTATVAARAEVNFVIEMPEGFEPPVAVAEATEPELPPVEQRTEDTPLVIADATLPAAPAVPDALTAGVDVPLATDDEPETGSEADAAEPAVAEPEVADAGAEPPEPDVQADIAAADATPPDTAGLDAATLPVDPSDAEPVIGAVEPDADAQSDQGPVRAITEQAEALQPETVEADTDQPAVPDRAEQGEQDDVPLANAAPEDFTVPEASATEPPLAGEEPAPAQESALSNSAPIGEPERADPAEPAPVEGDVPSAVNADEAPTAPAEEADDSQGPAIEQPESDANPSEEAGAATEAAQTPDQAAPVDADMPAEPDDPAESEIARMLEALIAPVPQSPPAPAGTPIPDRAAPDASNVAAAEAQVAPPEPLGPETIASAPQGDLAINPDEAAIAAETEPAESAVEAGPASGADAESAAEPLEIADAPETAATADEAIVPELAIAPETIASAPPRDLVADAEAPAIAAAEPQPEAADPAADVAPVADEGTTPDVAAEPAEGGGPSEEPADIAAASESAEVADDPVVDRAVSEAVPQVAAAPDAAEPGSDSESAPAAGAPELPLGPTGAPQISPVPEASSVPDASELAEPQRPNGADATAIAPPEDVLPAPGASEVGDPRDGGEVQMGAATPLPGNTGAGTGPATAAPDIGHGEIPAESGGGATGAAIHDGDAPSGASAPADIPAGNIDDDEDVALRSADPEVAEEPGSAPQGVGVTVPEPRPEEFLEQTPEVAIAAPPIDTPDLRPGETEVPVAAAAGLDGQDTSTSEPAGLPEAEVTASGDEDIPTLVATPVGDPEARRFASGKAIIRRGDNLWTIARRVYGEGIRYTTIYEANNDNIRDPDRIYPGQVFDLPEEVDRAAE